jgi:hypothetical protein
MKITLTKVVLGFNALQRIGTEKMPIKQAYTFQRNMRIMEPDVKAYEEKRIELIKTKYGSRDENDNWSVVPTKISQFTKELNDLGSVEIDLDVRVIDPNDVILNIAPNDLFDLEWMFVEEVKIIPVIPPENKKK